jgi:hypothetical protein
MTKDESTREMPGSRLLQFAERFFGQVGLEKIALPIIADLQHEYSSRSDKPVTRLLILLRGYLSFWKATCLYGLFSSRGDVRPFQSIGFTLFLGAASGTIVSIFIWMGNQTKGLAMLFPDWFTALLFLSLLFLAIWSCTRHMPDPRFRKIWKAAWRIASANGIILATVIILISLRLFHNGIGFINIIVAYGFTQLISLVCGFILSLLVWGMFVFRSGRTAC